MFKELSPLLRHRAVLVTITSAVNDQIHVNVVPKRLKQDENPALTTSLRVTGTAEELDADLGRTLVEYVGAQLQLKNTLEQAKAEMDAAAKEAQAEARAKKKTPAKTDANNTTSTKLSQLPAKAVEPVLEPRPQTASLFDMSSEEPSAVVPHTPKTDITEEDDIISEVNEENQDGIEPAEA